MREARSGLLGLIAAFTFSVSSPEAAELKDYLAEHSLVSYGKQFTNSSTLRPYGEFTPDSLFNLKPPYLLERLRGTKKAIEEAYEAQTDLSKEYSRNSKEEKLQKNIARETHYLHEVVIHDMIFPSFGRERLTQEQLDYSLVLLEDAKKLFGKHPYHYVIQGRQKNIVRVAHGKIPCSLMGDVDTETKKMREKWEKEGYVKRNIGILTRDKGFKIFRELESYKDLEIEPWENPGFRYFRLEEMLKEKSERIPPEYRK
jgi:hypothetical protein